MVADPALNGSLGSDVATLLMLFANLTASVDNLVLALSYATFHPVGQMSCWGPAWAAAGCGLHSVGGNRWVHKPCLPACCPAPVHALMYS